MRVPPGWHSIADSGESLRLVPLLVDAKEREMTIYALVASNDPKRVRYVGRTMCPDSRFDDHLRDPAAAIARWFRTMEFERGFLRMVQLERCKPHLGDRRENHWLQYYKSLGMADLNTARVQKLRQRASA